MSQRPSMRDEIESQGGLPPRGSVRLVFVAIAAVAALIFVAIAVAAGFL